MITLRKPLLLLIVGCLQGSSADAQSPQSYSSYYQKNIQQTGGEFRGTNVNSYLFDKYYSHSRDISPYANLGRGTSGDSYQHYIRPEQQRRQAFQSGMKSYIADRKKLGNVGYTDYGFAQQLQRGVPSVSDIPPAQKTSGYYKHWYSK